MARVPCRCGVGVARDAVGHRARRYCDVKDAGRGVEVGGCQIASFDDYSVCGSEVVIVDVRVSVGLHERQFLDIAAQTQVRCGQIRYIRYIGKSGNDI